MKRLLLLPLLLALCTVLRDGPLALPEAYASPQATVSSYWFRMLERRPVGALDCFIDSDPSQSADMVGLPELVELRCRDFHVAYRSRGIVDVAYRIEYRIAMGDSLTHFPTGDQLQLTNSGWKIARPLLVAADRP